MSVAALFDESSSDRELVRRLRRGAGAEYGDGIMPESIAWQVFLELRRRGVARSVPLFLTTLRNLHSRRCIGSVHLSTTDGMPDEHRIVEIDDPFLADLWKAYKKCIQANRTGPASQLLRDIEEQLAK
jgi:hypothetical protein